MRPRGGGPGCRPYNPPGPVKVFVAMSGGVARNPGVVRALRDALGSDLAVPAEPDTVGALGAALIARERAQR